MIDHISFEIANKESIEFYRKTLSILDCVEYKYFEYENIIMVGFNENTPNQNPLDNPTFWISYNTKKEHELIGKAKGFHVAFKAKTTEQINAWYEKCLELGAKDNGKPELKEQDNSKFYAAYVIDPSGWRIEAVLHDHKC